MYLDNFVCLIGYFVEVWEIFGWGCIINNRVSFIIFVMVMIDKECI